MPARPLSEDTLQLIDAVRTALADCSDVQEKRMFGCHVFMVNGKLCLGVEGDELLVRLPPAMHAEVAETPGLRPLSSKGLMDGYFYISPAAYATRAQWQHWIGAALAFNPLAKATPKKAGAKARQPESVHTTAAATSGMTPKSSRLGVLPPVVTPPTPRKHSVFDDDDDL